MDRKDFESLLNKYPDCVSDGKKLKSYIKDLYPDTPKAIMNTLMTMADDGIISKMQKNRQSALLLSRFKKTLVDDYGLSEQIVAQCFKIAIGVQESCLNEQPLREKEDVSMTPSMVLDYDEKEFEIENGVLIKCFSNKKSITVPYGVEIIASTAFCGDFDDEYISAESISIPDSVTKIADGAFLGLWNLECINVSNNNNTYSSIGGILYDKEVTKIIFVPHAIKGKVIIPCSITSIPSGCFTGRREMTSVVLHNNVLAFYGLRTFMGCSGLTSIIIPKSVRDIGFKTFFKCKNLTIYCEAEEEPMEWKKSKWNPDNRPVVWGVK